MQRPVSDHVSDPSQILRVGTIAGVDLTTGLCEVEFGDPEEGPVSTALIQWGVIRAGETIVWSPPSLGEQVLLFCPDGDIAQAIPFGALYSDSFPAPGNGAREFIRFGDGAEIGYDPEAHHYDITLPAGATARIEADGGVSIKGDVSIEGKLDVSGNIATEADLSVQGGADVQGEVSAGDVIGAGKRLSSHTHTGVTSGAGSSGPPL
ncbi:MAG: hypothetical protein BGO57_13195 [Sphingomonadales bacterium 63-6]|nr:MAG: hypothetical protein BGO57_13195 [Sphingomonadales bacterium 63-6]